MTSESFVGSAPRVDGWRCWFQTNSGNSAAPATMAMRVHRRRGLDWEAMHSTRCDSDALGGLAGRGRARSRRLLATADSKSTLTQRNSSRGALRRDHTMTQAQGQCRQANHRDRCDSDSACTSIKQRFRMTSIIRMHLKHIYTNAHALTSFLLGVVELVGFVFPLLFFFLFCFLFFR